MSGFDAKWLTLREPADQAARSKATLDRFVEALSGRSPARIMDIGCGTGSTYRSLAPHLDPNTRWQLVDYEDALLDEARRLIGGSNNVSFQRLDLNALDDTDIVTASALFDLCSARFCDDFLARLARQTVGLYAALNYDGVMEWSISHPVDAQVVRDFNLHQQSDKGFGAALGPEASQHLFEAGTRLGFHAEMARSPWKLGPRDAELQLAFLDGLEQPVREVGRLSQTGFSDWLAFRRNAVTSGGSVCHIGHTDVLLLPAG